MLQHDEDDKRYRSTKLCQLIYDRQINSEIGFEIRKLLEEGVLIDFQDQNHNKKTAIHLAVEKRDVICVEFLLRFKPNLRVKDGDGKTPIDLAESNGFENILKALLNSTFDVVNELFVAVIDCESLTLEKIEAIKSRPTFKVLKLINCPSVNHVWRKLNGQDYTTAFNESTHLFFIVIETNDTSIRNNHKLMNKVLNIRRPMIVQLTSLKGKRSQIYFKDDKKTVDRNAMQITQEEFNEAVESEDERNLNLLVAALRSTLFGHFSGDLLETKLNTNEDRSEAVNQFARSNALCHRFLELFDKGQPQIDRVVATLSFKGDQSLLALLNLPFELKDEKLKLAEYQQDILGVVDSSGCNLLMMAVEQRNLDAVKLLLRCGCDFNHSDNYDKRASDICWEMNAFDCLAELIEAGSPYPNNFRIDKVKESFEALERINAMIEAINSFHGNIQQGETEEVKMFITRHPHIKHAFDTNNKCALTVALESDKANIHSLLLSKGFEPGADDEYYPALVKFENKFNIRDSHRKYFREAFDEPHLKRLLKMSKLSFGSKDRANCSTIIRRMFDELNEIDEVIPILQICSLSDKLQIVFDFNCDSVSDMDPTKESTSLGAVYPSDGFVYIGAKNHKTEFSQVVGSLVHELTHYAMKLTYDNSCKPYDDDDTESENRFEAIAKETKKICDENSLTDSIVTTVFKCYTNQVWHAELIVRVPHLLAHHKMNPRSLQTAKWNTPELFHFYREKTLKDVERESIVLLRKYLITKINNQTGIARKLENMNVKFENVEIDLKPSVNVITSNAPKLTLAMLSQIDSDSSHIFVSLEQVATGNILDKIAKMNAKESQTALIVDCIGQTQKYPESLRKLLKDMKNIKTIALVMTEAEGSTAKQNFPKIELETLDHKWGELTESSKVHLLNQNVIFQGVEMKLNKLVDPASEAMNFFPLGELVDCKNFKIGQELHQSSHKFYIPRKFIKKGEANAKSFEELLRDESKPRVMIISDDAGSGKSVTLFEIAKSLHDTFPDRYVLFVDLRRHIEAFKAFKLVKDYEKIESFEDFIAQNILKNEPKFDRELFLQMFQAGKTFVLLDGFDEISPNYKNLLLHVLKFFDPRSGNQLHITTRPHLEADLERALGQFVFMLEKFSKECQKRILRDYWRSVEFEISQEDFEVLSQRLLQKLSTIASRSNIVGLPLLMRMAAEIFDDPHKENLLHKVESLSIASVFREFVKKHLKIWKEKGNENEIVRNENVDIDMAGGILEIHHNIALEHIFDHEFMNFHFDECDDEKISRVGLIQYDKTEKTFQFIHETFAEYFVADFISFHLNRKSQNPSHECRLAIQFFMKVSMSDKFQVIKNFLVQAMTFSPSEEFCKSVALGFTEVLKSENRFDFLQKSLRASRETPLAICLLSIVKHVEKEVLLKMLQSKTSRGNVLLDAALSDSNAVVSTLCDIITTCTDNPKGIYQVRGYYGNVLLTAARNTHRGVLTTLCAHLNSVLTKDEITIMFQQKGKVGEDTNAGNTSDWYGMNVITTAADYSNEWVTSELISLLPNYFTHYEVESLVRAADNRNRNSFNELIIDVVKSEFDYGAQQSFFYQPATTQKMFQFSENYERLADERLSVGEKRSLLFYFYGKGENCLNLAVSHSEYKNTNMIETICKTIKAVLNVEEQKKFVRQKDPGKRNVFLHAARNDKIFNFRSLYDALSTILSKNEINEMLKEKDSKGNNILHFLCRRRRNYYDSDSRDLFAFLRDVLTDDELRDLLFDVNSKGRNFFHCAVKFSRISVVKSSTEFIKEILSQDDKKIYFGIKNPNVFHLAANNLKLNSGIFSALHECLKDVLTKNEIKSLIQEKNSEKENVLHLICQKGFFDDYDNVKRLRDFFKLLKIVCEADELKNILTSSDYNGSNCLLLAAQFKDRFFLKELFSFIQSELSIDDQLDLIKKCSTDWKNIFTCASLNENSKMLSIVEQFAREILSENQIKELLMPICQEQDTFSDTSSTSTVSSDTAMRHIQQYEMMRRIRQYEMMKRIRQNTFSETDTSSDISLDSSVLINRRILQRHDSVALTLPTRPLEEIKKKSKCVII